MTDASMDCAFCRIVAGEKRAGLLFETPEVLAFLDNTQATAGHTLIIPKTHHRDLLSIPPLLWVRVCEAAQLAVVALDAALEARAFTLFQANSALGWQDVFHLHLHCVPRYPSDELQRPWAASRVGDNMLEHRAGPIRSSIRNVVDEYGSTRQENFSDFHIF